MNSTRREIIAIPALFALAFLGRCTGNVSKHAPSEAAHIVKSAGKGAASGAYREYRKRE